MDRLLSNCFSYADKWTVKFNPEKSISYSLFRPECASFEVNGITIPRRILALFIWVCRLAHTAL